MTNVTNKFYYDASHGWLAVKTKVLQELGLADKISKHSYVKGATVYLEEDVDMVLYIDAMKDRGVTVNAVSIDHGKRSLVRNYNMYHTNSVTATPVVSENTQVENSPEMVVDTAHVIDYTPVIDGAEASISAVDNTIHTVPSNKLPETLLAT
jgi:acetylglutamate synthase